MTEGVFTLDVSAVDSGFANDEARQLIECWRRSNGLLNDSLLPLSRRLIMLNGNYNQHDAPEILFAGNDALASRILGDGWARHPETGTMDTDYRCLISEAYRVAILQRRPVFDLVSTTLHAQGRSIHLRYHRVIVPLETMQGAPFLGCYSFPAGTDLPVAPGKPDGVCLPRQQQRKRGQAGPFVAADFPSHARA
ncbi:hypothetical protein FIV06_15625 [Labrenzia sp. THAF191b]|uniref:hypothetical protein n=1 Tax=unclassified Labrenzia TaxID=2648686 RepID=UPI001268AC14|nr:MULTISPECIES: hypothetical protein [unclassified Labrenzia]QFS98857.1 hypothetical protein FIV06_15625 [Labrenzia sp. THAF191b]QFT05171.1 hypothetical protein FIV05_15620 [Labrenzia sp. THAF191a]QFT16715.1 hypothetical protein FIV03_15635 [Labrenzia sp. THAF187b]